MVLIEDDDGPTSIAGVMGGARSEVGADTTRVLMEVANWDGANIHRTSLKLGLRSEASGRFEKQLQPEQALEAQAVATQLMIELCGARLAPGHDRRRRRRAAAAHDPPPRRAGHEPARRRRSRASAASEILEALEFTTADADDGLDVTVAGLPPRRHHARGRPDRGGRAARRAREAAGDAALAPRRVGRLTARQRLRRRAADALAAQGLHEIVGLELRRVRSSPTGSGCSTRRARRPSSSRTRCRPSSRSCARRCSARCSTSPRDNRARGAGTLRLFEAGRGVPADRAGPSCRASPTTLGALLTGAVRPPTWRDSQPRAGRLLRRQGRARGPAGHAPRVDWALERAARAVPAPGSRGARSSSAASRPAGSARSIRSSPRSGSSTTRSPRSSSTSTPSPSRETALYRDLTELPRVREDLAVVVAEHVTAAQRARASSGAPGRRCSAAAEVFDVYRDPERLGAGNVSLALRLTYRAPRPDADRRGGRGAARGDRARRWPTSSAGGSVPHSVSRCSGAPGSPAR